MVQIQELGTRDMSSDNKSLIIIYGPVGKGILGRRPMPRQEIGWLTMCWRTISNRYESHN